MGEQQLRRGVITATERATYRTLIEEAVSCGARKRLACECIGLGLRRFERWEKSEVDRRTVIEKNPPNRLSPEERMKLLNVVNQLEHCDLSPRQIVPRLADQGIYLASESTIYRVLREEGQLAHRGRSRPPRNQRPEELVATRPNQIWSWDITYLRAEVKGEFYYLYLILDVYSRLIVGHAVHRAESAELAATLIDQTALRERINKGQLVLHSDNGGPMKGATMLATLQQLGVVPSFSRPRVSDDNPYSEAIFKTLKYRPSFPDGRFASIEEATAWVERFVTWYNEQHLHSAIGFVTPRSRHDGRDAEVLEKRKHVYRRAQKRHPERWTADIRDCETTGDVYLNPRKEKKNKSSLYRVS